MHTGITAGQGSAAQDVRCFSGVFWLGLWSAVSGEMVEKTARGAIRRVHGADEAPRLWQQLSHGCCLHLGEVGTTMHATKVGDVAEDVELVGHNHKTSRLHLVQACGCLEVASGEKVFHGFANIWQRSQDLLHVWGLCVSQKGDDLCV